MKIFNREKIDRGHSYREEGMMSKKEISERYGIDVDDNRVFIVDTPSFTFNVDDLEIINKHSDSFTVINSKLVLKPGNKTMFIKTYTPNYKPTLKKDEFIFIYPERIDNNRYLVVKDVNYLERLKLNLMEQLFHQTDETAKIIIKEFLEENPELLEEHDEKWWYEHY